VLIRCDWCGTDPLYVRYHDEEWGVPVHDDRRLFEMLVLEGAQAGLSWRTILGKRARYREVFAGFDPERVARFTPADVERLLADPGIVRNRLKVAGAVKTARAVLGLAGAHGSLDAFLWAFVDGAPIVNQWADLRSIPASTPVSDALSRALKDAGATFVGSTVCYAFMQAVGMVDDHVASCWRRTAQGPVGPPGPRGQTIPARPSSHSAVS
jgi:DNA-3-methyladenine glycosylase I